MTTIDSASFRQVLGHFPTGVTVVTARNDDGPVGTTIGSFTSVSLDPPLVGFLPMVSSNSWPVIEQTNSFCVNVLGDDQGDLCWRFASSSVGDKFGDVPWEAAPSGCPILGGAIAWIDCSVEAVHEMGDHIFVLGRVQALSVVDDPGDPLLFFRGTLRSLASAPDPAS